MSRRAQETRALVREILTKYPEKTAKKRAGHIAVKETTVGADGQPSCSACAVASNVKSIPGVMTARGCASPATRSGCAPSSRSGGSRSCWGF